jgi:hypothetical protein
MTTQIKYTKRYFTLSKEFKKVLQHKLLVAKLEVVGSNRKRKPTNKKRVVKHIGYRLYMQLNNSPLDALPF